MTAKRGTPQREFYLSRARMLYARRNLFGIERFLSCIYILCIAAPKKAITYLLNKKHQLATAVFRGTFSGLFSKSH